MTYLLVGNFGVGNAGDEILKEYFLKRFPEVQWLVCSAKPMRGELPRFPAGFRSFFSFRWFQTWKALRRANGVVFGGGSLFTDTESLRACVIWYMHTLFTRLARKPYFLAFQGVGPFRTRIGEWCASNAVTHAKFISVRDEASIRLIQVWKKNTEIVQSFDPSILLLQSKRTEGRSNNVLIFIPRLSTEWTAVSEAKTVEILRKVQEVHKVHLLSLQQSEKHEKAHCHKLSQKIGVSVKEVQSMQEVMEHLADAFCVLTQRYHGAVAALAAGVPFISLKAIRGDKLDALASLCACPSVPLSGISSELILDIDWGRVREGLVQVKEECTRKALFGERALKEAMLRQ